jgi:hypothetical protein
MELGLDLDQFAELKSIVLQHLIAMESLWWLSGQITVFILQRHRILEVG